MLLITWLGLLVQAASVIASQAYGIGIQCTPAYGTIAVSYSNGTNVGLARVDGDQQWHDLMFWLCVDTRYPLVTSADVFAARVIFVEMLQSLVEAGSLTLGQWITAAAVSLPAHNRVHHYGEFSAETILREAFTGASLGYVPILPWPSEFGEKVTYAENSVLAGHNLSLCHPYTADRYCSNGSRAPPDLRYLVGYYANELELTGTSATTSAYAVHQYPHPSRDLGAGSKVRADDEETYWKAVRMQIIKSQPGAVGNITKLIFYGDRAGDERLRHEVTTTLAAFGQTPVVVDSDPVYIGAMGTAEFAKRKPYFDVLPDPRGGLAAQSKPDL